MIPNSIEHQKKTIPNGPIWCPGTLQKWYWKQVIFQGHKKWAPRMLFLSLLARLARFWATFGAQLGAKGVPQSSFLAPGYAKMTKNDVQDEASEKVWIFDWIFVRKHKILKGLNPPKCFIYIYIYKHFGGFRRLLQNREFHSGRRASPPHPKTSGHFR